MKKLKIPRSLVLLIVFFIMFSILIVRLFQLQIVKGQEYENNFILQTKREIVLSGARGNIYDRNGKPLATNKLANSVTFEDQETYNSDRERQLNLNSKIYQMICIIKSKGDSIETSLKIIIDPNGNFQFSNFCHGLFLTFQYDFPVYSQLQIRKTVIWCFFRV